MKQIHVVGAALIENGKVLATKRNEDRILGSLWEFPGGKIEPGETPEQALKREIEEEFSDEITVGIKVGETSSITYDFGTVNLSIYLAKFNTHNFHLIAHSDIQWIQKDDLEKMNWADADKLAVQALKKIDFTKVDF
ncbi:(deoxy)nucleoside triphosphate pyrophosphohydrolase [Paucilactobacillus nenjiangensis]|jgi:8-oxo-dGTP diphosphatase|uniref:8-oxo-dGTP diphosphatase n=1 Tax=Paucilactobacillus nenjiangensis TaxID=1296540 RepID=A0A5P1X2X0_9LACO|nr:(deoxy)nucleoside triphosphate pyrophosphohydrolase [Paucilactobacillus nenjiangensis]QER66537.1 (deoxy)nucleoside triphosphate pyrophosphohydrolase [Paucilactobacillus nenjiangensis]